MNKNLSLSVILSLCIGIMAAVLATVLSVSCLSGGTTGSIVFALIVLLVVFLTGAAAMLRFPLFHSLQEQLLSLLLLYLALMLRLSLFDFQSPDYVSFLSVWTEKMRNMTIHEALVTPIGDYNMPYLYLLLLVSRLPFYDVYCIKLISVAADVAAALAAAHIVCSLGSRPRAVLCVFAAALLCPTTFLNSAYWGQCDSVYGALCIWGLYCGLNRKSRSCWLLMALGLSFKLQAVFLLPILAVLLCGYRIRLRDLWIFPAAFVGMSIPVLLAGRSFSDTFSIYMNQTQSYPYLSLNAPSFWSMIDNSYYERLSTAAVLLAMILTIFFLLYMLPKAKKLTDRQMLELSMILSLMIPWLLPKMHERYFYLAEMLSLCYVGIFHRRIPVAVVIMTGGFLAYHLYLFGEMPILSLANVAAIYGITLLYIVYRLFQQKAKELSIEEGGNNHEQGPV